MEQQKIRIILWSLVGVVLVVAVGIGAVVFLQQEKRSSPDEVVQRNVGRRGGNIGVQPPQESPANDALTRLENPQIGVNFIRVLTEEADRTRGGRGSQKATPTEDITQPTWIFDDFEELGVQAYRQMTEADLLWQNVESEKNAWSFTAPDAVLPNAQFEPIVTLFAMQYASGTPPWATTSAEFEPELGTDARAYLDAVLERYASTVKYWEIGNEMDHWRAADPTATGTAGPGASSLPSYAPTTGYSAQEQGVFLAQAAEYIRAKDSDAIIVLPGMAGLDTYATDTWLTGVIEGGGTDFFDVMNYHYYGSWKNYSAGRERLSDALQTLGIADKPVWLTETGVTSDATMTQRTNYPNSTTEQAADVFRRIVLAYAHGDDLVLWHSHVSSSDEGSSGDWRAYGLHSSTGVKKPSWYTYQLLVDELIPFTDVETIHDGSNGMYVYSFTTEDGEKALVAWGAGTYTPEDDGWEMTSVSSATGKFTFTSVRGGVTLSEIPVILH